MNRFKKLSAVLISVMCLFSLASCGSTDGSGTAEETRTARGAMKVSKVTYCVYYGDRPEVDMYVLTPDLKGQRYNLQADESISAEYLTGELPSEDLYDLTEFEISENDWSSIVNVLTRVDFMTLPADMTSKQDIQDGSVCYISVEANGSANISGGYEAGSDDDPDSRRFAEAREYIEHAIN